MQQHKLHFEHFKNSWMHEYFGANQWSNIQTTEYYQFHPLSEVKLNDCSESTMEFSSEVFSRMNRIVSKVKNSVQMCFEKKKKNSIHLFQLQLSLNYVKRYFSIENDWASIGDATHRYWITLLIYWYWIFEKTILCDTNFIFIFKMRPDSVI